MSGFLAFLRKEAREITRTSRLWVLPGILLFLGLTSPIIAQLTPLIVESTAENQPGVVIQIPDPTYIDAYRNYLSQLTQLMVIAVIIASAGLISSEINRGTAILVLTKPVSRTGFFLAKVLSQTGVLLLATILGTAAAFGLTAALFGEAPVADLLVAMALWFGFAWLLLAVSAFFSALIGSQAGAAGASLGAWLVIIVVSELGRVGDYTPAALMGLAGRAIEGEAIEPLVPLLVTGAALAVVLALGVRVVQTKEI